MNARPFHEWPLVVFTTLAIMGAGLVSAPLVAALWHPASAAEMWRPALAGRTSPAAASDLRLLGTALLAAGMLVSLAHLGRPRRAPLALARVGRSRLSSEITLASITLAAGVCVAAFPGVRGLSPAAALLAPIAAIALLVSLGLVYALPGQLAWCGPVVASPLVLGLGFGMVSLATLSSWNPARAGFAGIPFADIAPAGATVLAADVARLAWRSARAKSSQGRALLAVRVLLVDVLPGCLLLASLPKGAAGFLGLGILVDRLAFYLGAVQRTTEAEIARVEAVIGGGGETR